MDNVKFSKAMDSTDDDITLSLLEDRNRTTFARKTSNTSNNLEAEQNVFELQLTQIQDQLVAAMVHNQNLEEENKTLKKENHIEELINELKEEKQRRKNAEEKLKRLIIVRNKKNSEVSNVSADSNFDDVNHELGDPIKRQKSEEGGVVNKRTRLTNIFLQYKIVMWNFVHERVSDFVNDDDAVVTDEVEEQLSVKRLKENVSRFSDAIQPIKTCYQYLTDLFSWKNPWLTLIVFLVYVYSLWLEMAIPLLFMLVLLQLWLNYLNARGIAQKFTVPKSSAGDEETKDETSSSLSERYQLVLHIARKVQNTLGTLADSLEKIHNLLMWQHEEASRKLLQFILFLFVVALFLPSNTFLKIVGILCGMKLFLVTPIYTRFPKVQRRYDDFQRLWLDLPTHSENLQRKLERVAEANEDAEESSSNSGSSSPKGAAPKSSSTASGSTKVAEKSGETTWESIVFSERFLLSKNEIPLHDWQEGRRCTMMDKESPLSSMKHGRLYLTSNHICFERNQFHSKKNIAIALTSIKTIRKTKPISFMPGPGMAIEITVKESSKPYLFAAMMSRDEAFDSIIRAGKLLNLSWAK